MLLSQPVFENDCTTPLMSILHSCLANMNPNIHTALYGQSFALPHITFWLINVATCSPNYGHFVWEQSTKIGAFLSCYDGHRFIEEGSQRQEKNNMKTQHNQRLTTIVFGQKSNAQRVDGCTNLVILQFRKA